MNFSYTELLTSIKDQVTDLISKGLPLERIIDEVKGEKIGDFKREFISNVYRMVLKHEIEDNNKN